MRFIASIVASVVLLASHAAFARASLAYVLTFDPETAQNKHKISLSSLSPDTARLVLAQRAGVEDYHTALGLNNEEINAINTYGTKTRMFDGGKPGDKVFLLAELDPEAESNAMLRMHARFTVSDPPSFESSQELFQDLFQQSHPTKPRKSTYLTNKSYLDHIDSPVFHIASDAGVLVNLARELAAKKMTVTALLVPAGSRSGSWGSYKLPGDEKFVQKRQLLSLLETEEPLPSSSIAGIAPSAGAKLSASNSSSNYSNTEPLKGILPSCFRSEKACNSNTRGCTGHGSCKLRYTDADKAKRNEVAVGKNNQCWACSCTSTKKDGLTTKWGGPACQKKDISMEFWLITLFTVGLVSAVSFAVGNLWSMGEQELPSVIGAGVSGPTARK